VLADGAFREQISGLLKKSIYDHGRFLPHFYALETPPPPRSSGVEDDTSLITTISWSEWYMRSFFLKRCVGGARHTPPSTAS
jgi:hypothetical protein